MVLVLDLIRLVLSVELIAEVNGASASASIAFVFGANIRVCPCQVKINIRRYIVSIYFGRHHNLVCATFKTSINLSEQNISGFCNLTTQKYGG